MVFTRSVEPSITWTTVRAWERERNVDAKLAFWLMTGLPDVQVAGYYQQLNQDAEVLVFVDVIQRHRTLPWAIFSAYATEWAPLTHTLIHEICHDERVEEILLATSPSLNPHVTIDLFIRDKVLLPLERDIQEDDACRTPNLKLNLSPP